MKHLPPTPSQGGGFAKHGKTMLCELPLLGRGLGEVAISYI